MSISEPPQPNGCAYCVAYCFVYGLVALGFWKLLEIIVSPFL